MPRSPPQGLRNARILVVDDEADIGTALKDLLETSFEAEVHVCGSGQEALELLRRTRVDLIITDYKMPGMTGVQFLEAAKSVAPGVGHLLITAFDRELVQDLARRGQRERIVHKPVEPDELLDRVVETLDAAPTR